MMRRMYIHEHPDWPNFHWDRGGLAGTLADVRNRQGRLIGRMESLGFALQREAALETLTEDVLKSSEIEGESLDGQQVRSSIASRLGMDIGGLTHIDHNVDGIVEMMMDATESYAQPLTAERLCAWHGSLFPTGMSGMRRIMIGAWRDDAADPMQVVSGPVGRQRVHFEAPRASRLNEEMRAFLDWFNAPADIDDVLKAGLAHLRFVTIHPFEDGNGRIARAIADMALARSDRSAQRFYSMSSQIRRERADYYDILERTQKGSMDVSAWMRWFLDCLGRAIDDAQATLSGVLDKARFWERAAHVTFNERQRRIITRLLEGKFEGKLTTSKWARLSKCSQDTALRDITDLMAHGVLVRNPGGGRSTSYDLVRTS